MIILRRVKCYFKMCSFVVFVAYRKDSFTAKLILFYRNRCFYIES